MFDLLSEKNNHLVSSIPLLYWIYLLGEEFQTTYLFIAIVYAGSVVINALIRTDLLHKIKSGFTKKDFAEYFKKNRFLLSVLSVIHFLFGLTSFILILLSRNKGFFVWTLIFAYGMLLCYSLINLARYKNTLEQIEKQMTPKKK